MHCWLCHVRLLDEPKELTHVIRSEMMEKLWGQATIDLSEQGIDFIRASKILKVHVICCPDVLMRCTTSDSPLAGDAARVAWLCHD